MIQHLRANLWLLVLTILICSVLYPAALWCIGQTVFSHRAQGSLLDKDGRPTADEEQAVGSRLIAQPFNGDEYFKPRPSAVSYNGAASGASNWGASNPALRKRVVGMLGQVLKYRDGRPIGPDIVAWTRENLRQNPAVLVQWSKDDPNLAERWTNADALNADFVAQWEKDHPDDLARWRRENPDSSEMTPADLAELFFESFAKGENKTWPETDGRDIQTAFFEVWWRANSNAELRPVPADMVMASGSGLDPHITLDNALYQVDRVASQWAEKKKSDRTSVHKEIETLLRESATSPLGGLVGIPLINVLEVNLALQERYGS